MPPALGFCSALALSLPGSLSQGVAYLLAIFGEALHRNPGKEAAQINDAESQGAFGFLPFLAAQLGISQGTGLVAHLEAQAHGLVQDITAL